MRQVWLGIAGVVALVLLVAVVLRGSSSPPAPAPTPAVRTEVAPVRPAPVPTGDALPGKLPMKLVADTVKKQQDNLQPCYDTERYDDPTFAGRWTISFTVTPEGRVTDAYVEGAPHVIRMERCMTEAIVTWTFPASEQGATVRRSFRFDPPAE